MADANLEMELAAALRSRLELIGNRALRESDPARHLEELRGASERIEELQARLPPSVHPQLRHYLDRCSYDKALAWIEQQGLLGSGR